MAYYGDIHLGDTIDFAFTTTSASTGAPTTLSGVPVLSAYVGSSLTQLTAGITLTVDFDGVTGMNHVTVVATSGNGYTAATNIDVVITTGTVGGTSAVGYVVGSFSIDKRGVNQILGTAVSTPATAGVLDVNVKNINNVATTSVTTVSANQGTTQPLNFTGTAGSALVKSDMVDIAGAAVSTTTAQIGVNTVQLNAQTVTAAAGVTFPSSVASPTNITAGTITTVTTVTNQLTAAQIATGVWQDTTAGDFTTASSIGKSLYTTGNAPGAASGLALVGSNMGTVSSVTGSVGSVTGAVGSVTGAVGSVTGNVGGNVTGSVGSVVGAVGSVTAAVSVTGDFSATMKTSIGTAVAASAVASVTGNVGGNVTGNVVGSVGSVTAGVSLTSSERTSVADAVLDRDMSLGTDSGSSSVRTPRQALRALRNKNSAVAGIVYKEDDTTTSWSYTVTTDAAAVPITVLDPA